MRTSTYDQDFYAWTQAQAAALRTARPNRFDWKHIAEELEAIGRSERDQMESRIRQILSHPLKWQCQPWLRSRRRSTGPLEQNPMNEAKWDDRYLETPALVASWSKDPRAKVGAVVVRNNRVVATGFNGLPSEVMDNEERLNDKKIKLEMTVHAEENALIVAGRNAEDATIYVHGKPVCARCAGSIIQARIARVVAMHHEMDDNRKKVLGVR